MNAAKQIFNEENKIGMDLLSIFFRKKGTRTNSKCKSQKNADVNIVNRCSNLRIEKIFKEFN